MFPIYLLEDDRNQLSEYKETIEKTIMINDFAMSLVGTACTVEEFNSFFKVTQYGLFFLDMEIGDDKQAGLRLASFIRERMPMSQIVFITTHSELSFLTLERKIAPMDYVLKDLTLNEIKEHIGADIELAQKIYKNTIFHRVNTFGYKIGSRFFSVPLDDVIALHTSKEFHGRVILSSLNKEATFSGNLNNLENKYDIFFRCDKSWLVNLDKVVSYDSHTRKLKMVRDSECDVSYRKSGSLTRALKDNGK
ncbi:response regulator transcription factor [Companilactobacillus allii]|uniref:DNA-binding response regulator n=1 Tax=Companilactobacillus allii TaxID=1847728 RepID=A0A1P8Q1J4_9LACO|nr:response regulator transcription factor [Companilactobacillus allii]APX71659.1 DNA-binding response regulator [Companilactobacillus allii]USQ68742.1 response regulator transcription factor [Companilactobacillus allii]